MCSLMRLLYCVCLMNVMNQSGHFDSCCESFKGLTGVRHQSRLKGNPVHNRHRAALERHSQLLATCLAQNVKHASSALIKRSCETSSSTSTASYTGFTSTGAGNPGSVISSDNSLTPFVLQRPATLRHSASLMMMMMIIPRTSATSVWPLSWQASEHHHRLHLLCEVHGLGWHPEPLPLSLPLSPPS